MQRPGTVDSSCLCIKDRVGAPEWDRSGLPSGHTTRLPVWWGAGTGAQREPVTSTPGSAWMTKSGHCFRALHSTLLGIFQEAWGHGVCTTPLTATSEGPCGWWGREGKLQDLEKNLQCLLKPPAPKASECGSWASSSVSLLGNLLQTQVLGASQTKRW